VDRRGSAAVFLPQRIAVVGQGNTASTYTTTKKQVFSALEVAETYGYGSPLHLAVLQLLPTNGDGVGAIPVTVYPLQDSGTGTVAAGSITPAGAATADEELVLEVNNIPTATINVTSGDSVAVQVAAIVAALNAKLEMPLTAVDNASTSADLTSKWKGASANDISVTLTGLSASAGVSWGIVQPTGGTNNPVVDGPLAEIGNIWETMVINCLEIADSTALDTFSAWGEGRWGSLVRKPAIVFTGATPADSAAAITVPDARKTDRTNCQLIEVGGSDLPLVVAARQVARIAVVANTNPAHDYGSQAATGLTPGADGDQLNYAAQDATVKGGSSTSESRDGVLYILDVVTMYHPTGDPLPAYRYVVDIVKLQNVIFNTDIRFNTSAWDGAPLIPDDQPTVNPAAKKPKMAKAVMAGIIDGLALEAIISNPEEAKAGIVAAIDGANPKRLNMTVPIQVSGNTNIKSIDINWGFFFGGLAA
jgi:phage tail sheath gpL-like